MNQSDKMELFWGLGRAQYLTVPRSIIQEMPKDWQDKLADILNELDETVDWRPKDARYFVKLMDEEGEIELNDDPLMEYRHGNRAAQELFEETTKKRK